LSSAAVTLPSLPSSSAIVMVVIDFLSLLDVDGIFSWLAVDTVAHLNNGDS
jgi:hypothetical protein